MRARSTSPIPIEKASFWLANRATHVAESPSLKGETTAEYVIIGAGFTGLWTAWFLKQLSPQSDVVVVEQGIAGYGASGRNAGIVSGSIDHSHALAVVHFGREEAARLCRIGRQNFDELAAFARDDCGFERSGQLHVALTEKQIEHCHHTVAIAHELGLSGARVLSQSEVRAELHSPLYLGAAFHPDAGIIDPIALVDKIKREAAAAGVRFFDRSPVARIETAQKIARVHTTAGRVTAQKIILATDAYSHHLVPALRHRFLPLYDYVLCSEPLSRSQLAQIGWRNRQGVTDERAFFNYYRLTRDDRILFGTSEACYYSKNRVDEACDHSPPHYAALRESFARHFPTLADLAFPYAWGGPIASTTRLTPFFGTRNSGRVLFGLGYTGHGIGSTRLGGKILAHMALAQPSELFDLSMVQKHPFPYPPEPLRSLSVNAVTRALRRVDAGHRPNILLRILDRLGIGFSS